MGVGDDRGAVPEAPGRADSRRSPHGGCRHHGRCCPSTTDPETVREWLTWASAGMKGVASKKLDDACKPSVRGWEKYTVRETSQAIVGAVTGSPDSPACDDTHPSSCAGRSLDGHDSFGRFPLSRVRSRFGHIRR